MRIFNLKFLAAGFAFAALLFLGGGGYLFWQTERPGPASDEQILWVKPGSSLSSVARDLEKGGLVRSSQFFKLAGRVAGGPVRAGEFVVPAQSSVSDILRILQNGAPFQRQVTIPEGWNKRQVLARLAEDPFLTGDLPAADAVKEGSILPETYGFERGTERAVLLERMKRAQADALNDVLGDDPAFPPELLKTGRDPVEALITLASIVEKEAGHDAERGRIARAFLNRLGRNMRLEADPTVIYAVELAQDGAPLERPIYKRDLKLQSPYNTYVTAGLPPGPISNPGVASIQAVLSAPPGNELFFVADGTGGHVFAATLVEHNKNVRAWRAYERRQKAAN